MSASLVAKLRGVITPLFIVLCLSFCYLVVPFLAEKNFDVMNKAQAAEKVSAIADQGDDILLASYFESNENTRTHLYTSLDGESFDVPLAENAGQPVVDDKIFADPNDAFYNMRDPSIAYFDGLFWMTGFGGTQTGKASFQVGWSKDLIHWSSWNTYSVGFNVSPPKRSDGFIDSVAPEFFVDDNGKAYIIVCCGKYRNGSNNASLGTAEQLWTYSIALTSNGKGGLVPQTAIRINMQFNPDQDRIDSQIMKKDGKYYMFTKPSAINPIEVFVSNAVNGPYQLVNNDVYNSFQYNAQFTSLEGPSAVFFRNKIHLLADNFDQDTKGGSTTNRIRSVWSTDFRHWTTKQTISVTQNKNRHGSVIKLTDKHAKQVAWAFRNGIQYKNGDTDGDGIPDSGNQAVIQSSLRPTGELYKGKAGTYELDLINNSNQTASNVAVSLHVDSDYPSMSQISWSGVTIPARSVVTKTFTVKPSSTSNVRLNSQLSAAGTNCDSSAEGYTVAACTSPWTNNYVYSSNKPSTPKSSWMVLRKGVSAGNCDSGQWQDNGSILTICLTPTSNDGGSPVTYYEIKLKSTNGKKTIKRTANFDGKPYIFWNLPNNVKWSKPQIRACNVNGCSSYGNGDVSFYTSQKYGQGKAFLDLSESNVIDAAGQLRKWGVTTGIGHELYGPSGYVTRQQMAMFLWRLAGKPGVSTKHKFSDISKLNKDDQKAINWMYQSGVTTGIDSSHKKYSPKGYVSRQQMALFLYRLAGYLVPQEALYVKHSFTDISKVGEEDKNAIYWLFQEGITTGTDSAQKKFAPKNLVTRAQMALFLYREEPYLL